MKTKFRERVNQDIKTYKEKGETHAVDADATAETSYWKGALGYFTGGMYKVAEVIKTSVDSFMAAEIKTNRDKIVKDLSAKIKEDEDSGVLTDEGLFVQFCQHYASIMYGPSLGSTLDVIMQATWEQIKRENLLLELSQNSDNNADNQIRKSKIKIFSAVFQMHIGKTYNQICAVSKATGLGSIAKNVSSVVSLVDRSAAVLNTLYQIFHTAQDIKKLPISQITNLSPDYKSLSDVLDGAGWRIEKYLEKEGADYVDHQLVTQRDLIHAAELCAEKTLSKLVRDSEVNFNPMESAGLKETITKHFVQAFKEVTGISLVESPQEVENMQRLQQVQQEMARLTESVESLRASDLGSSIENFQSPTKKKRTVPPKGYDPTLMPAPRPPQKRDDEDKKSGQSDEMQMGAFNG